MEVQCFFSTYRLIMIYICFKFCKNIKRFQSYDANTLSILFLTMGHNSLNIIREVTDLVLCTSPNHGLQLYQVSQKYLEGFQSYGADTISILLQRGIIP